MNLWQRIPISTTHECLIPFNIPLTYISFFFSQRNITMINTELVTPSLLCKVNSKCSSSLIFYKLSSQQTYQMVLKFPNIHTESRNFIEAKYEYQSQAHNDLIKTGSKKTKHIMYYTKTHRKHLKQQLLLPTINKLYDLIKSRDFYKTVHLVAL